MGADLAELSRLVTAFRDARDWAQFHSLRSLIVSLNLEAGELLELTQWKTDAEIEALPADLHDREALEDFSLSHVGARNELRALIAGLNLPGWDAGKLG